MRKVLISITLLLLPLLAGAQAQINTKKVKIADFPEKVTKVVMTGNDFYDILLKEEVAAIWRLSPYEFCTLDEFNRLKHDDSYYFLLTVDGQFRKETEPGISFLTLVKGGKGAGSGIGKMLEVVSVPIASADDPSGREFVFMPVILDMIQKHTEACMNKDLNGLVGLSNSSLNMSKAGNMELIFSEDDLAEEVDRPFRDLNFDSDMIVTDEGSADRYIETNAADKLVSFVVAPSDPQPGSYCYKMLINAQTHELYYFRKHRISAKYGAGFLKEDINRISSSRGR